MELFLGNLFCPGNFAVPFAVHLHYLHHVSFKNHTVLWIFTDNELQPFLQVFVRKINFNEKFYTWAKLSFKKFAKIERNRRIPKNENKYLTSKKQNLKCAFCTKNAENVS